VTATRQTLLAAITARSRLPPAPLARYFGTSDRFWLNRQTRYELETEKDRLGRRLAGEVVRRAG
jgi:plasmid maintenance system antidote protein VapI